MVQVKLLLQTGDLLLTEANDAILCERDQFVKTFTFGANLKKTYPNSRIFLKEDGSNLLQEDGFKILFEDHVDGKTFTFGALLSRPTALKTITFGGTLKALSKTKTFTFGTHLKQTLTKSFTFGGTVKRIFSTPFLLLQTGDFILKEDSGKLQLEDTAIGKTFTFGAHLILRKTKSFTFGATLTTVKIKTFSFGGVLKNRFTKSFTFGGILKALGLLKTFTFGSKIVTRGSKSFTLGARIERFHFQIETNIPLLTSDEEMIFVLGQTETISTISTTNETVVNLKL